MMSSRSPTLFNETLTFRFADQFLESAAAISAMTRNGMHGPLRRELRHVLERAVKLAATDQRNPHASLRTRVEYLRDQLPPSSVDVGAFSYWGLDASQSAELQAEVKSRFKLLCRYVHPSAQYLEETLRAADRGSFLGFESATQISAVNRLTFAVYDICLVHLFETLGPGLTGDVFTAVFDQMPDWQFHKGRFTSNVSAFFDYKAERRDRKAPA